MSHRILSDKAIAAGVFLVTVFSTFAVIALCILKNQSAYYTVLYSLFTMWTMGIITYVVLKHIYMRVIRPHEIELMEHDKLMRTAEMSLNISDVEDIDTAIEKSKDLLKNYSREKK